MKKILIRRLAVQFRQTLIYFFVLILSRFLGFLSFSDLNTIAFLILAIIDSETFIFFLQLLIERIIVIDNRRKLS